MAPVGHGGQPGRHLTVEKRDMVGETLGDPQRHVSRGGVGHRMRDLVREHHLVDRTRESVKRKDHLD